MKCLFSSRAIFHEDSDELDTPGSHPPSIFKFTENIILVQVSYLDDKHSDSLMLILSLSLLLG